MAKRRVKFTFPSALIKEPIIYQVARRFDIVTNIRRAEVTETEGWVVLELEGTDDQIGAAIDWVRDLGVRVDPVEGDVIYG